MEISIIIYAGSFLILKIILKIQTYIQGIVSLNPTSQIQLLLLYILRRMSVFICIYTLFDLNILYN